MWSFYNFQKWWMKKTHKSTKRSVPAETWLGTWAAFHYYLEVGIYKSYLISYSDTFLLCLALLLHCSLINEGQEVFLHEVGSMMTYLEPSGNFLSKDVLRGMAAWCCWRICWHCSRSGPCVGEPRDNATPAVVGTRCHVVFLLKGVLYSQGVPSLSTLYSTMGMR